MATINQTKLIEIMSNIKGANTISFVARTLPKVLKKSRVDKGENTYGQIAKVSQVQGMVNFQYEAGVLRRLEKEGKSPEEYTRGESWHEAVTIDGRLTPFCKHKENGEYYLRFMFISRGKTAYFDQNNVEITEEEAAPFLPKPSEYANQGLDNPLIFLTYKLDSITEITMNGERYFVRS
jgi:hypothetical protein